MKPYDPHLQDLFDGDSNIYEDYHQDFSEGVIPRSSRAGVIIPLIICCIPIVYHILSILDYDVLPLPELLWNAVVYVTPPRLLDAVESYQNPLRITNPALKDIPRTHAEKSEAMRRVLGLDRPGGIIESVAQAGRRRLSTLPGINLSAQGDGRPAGLGNWDNSCYQNSVLQGLASLDSLSGYLTNPIIEDPVEGVEKPDMKMAEALRDLIATLNDPSNNGRRIWTPATLKNMSSWQQQDAQEYFSKVLDEIDKEMGNIAKLVRSSQGFESDDSSGPRSQSQEPSPISTFRNPLEGLIAQRVGCMRCGYSEGLSMIPFNCLTVPLTRSWECDVSECLDEYTKLEEIEGVECGKCTLLKYQRLLTLLVDKQKPFGTVDETHKKVADRLAAIETALDEDDYEEKTLAKKLTIASKNRTSSTKSRQAVIARPPKSLVVHFNRSIFDEMTGELKKNTSHVKFPRVLDLGPWCLGSSGSENTMTEEWLLNPDKPMIASIKRQSRLLGPTYELRAVVTHYGRHENGHYVCYKKSPISEPEDGEENKEFQRKEQWWRLSDDEVTKVSEDNVLGQGGVFMLFYDCIEPGTTRIPEIETSEATAVAPQIEASTITTSPSQAIEDSILPEISTVQEISLPDTDNEDLFQSDDQDSLPPTREESIATSVSEYDEEDAPDQELVENYQPAKAIVVPPYINKVGNNPASGEQKMMSPGGSLVMV